MTKKNETTAAATATDETAVNETANAGAMVAAPGGALPAANDAISFDLSQDEADRLVRELTEALHQAEQGFGTLAKVKDVLAAGKSFDLIDATTVPDFLDQTSGEISTKQVFKLEYPDGLVLMIMQSDSRPRRILADCFVKSRALGMKLRMGPYILKEHRTNQIQAAIIFEQQSGWRRQLTR